MNKIPSFTINHERLLRGIYVSRKNQVDGEVKSDVTRAERQ
jgi:S-ribosylhomocysteine lyase